MSDFKIAICSFATLVLSVSYCPSSSAQNLGPEADFMSSGGSAGCYEPARVNERQARLLEKMGASPCNENNEASVGVDSLGLSRSVWRASRYAGYVDELSGGSATLIVACTNFGPRLLVDDARAFHERLTGDAARTMRRQAFGEGTVMLGIEQPPRAALVVKLEPDLNGLHSITLSRPVRDSLARSRMISVMTDSRTLSFTGQGSANVLRVMRC
jgi:hypothetical protein